MANLETHENDTARGKFVTLTLLALLTWFTAAKCGTGDDTYWHIKVGEWVWQNQSVPATGIFSYTANEFPWVSHEWLSGLLIFAIFNLAGWPGLVLMATFSLTLAMLLLINFLVKRISINASIIFMLFAYFLAIPHIMPRPHILMLPMLVFWTSQLIDASENHNQPPYPMALVMTVWSNMHGSFIIGLAFVLFFAVEAVFTQPNAALRFELSKRWVLFFLFCLLATFINPHGVNGLLLPLKLTDQTYTIDIISEWLSPNFHGLQPLEFWLLSFIGLSLLKGLKLPFFRLVFILGLLHLSLKHVRFANDLLPFLSPLVLAAPLSRQLSRPPNFSIKALTPKNLAQWLILALYGTALALYLPNRIVESEESLQNGKVLAALETEKQQLGNVLNSYGQSIYLIHYGFPVFIDSRAELYGDKFIKKYFKTVNLEQGGQPLLDLIRKFNINWTVFETKLPINAYLSALPEWRTIYSDRFLTVYLKAGIAISSNTQRELERIKNSLPAEENPEAEHEEPF